MQGDAAPGKESQDGVMECVMVCVGVGGRSGHSCSCSRAHRSRKYSGLGT